jgi:hypothetical protein
LLPRHSASKLESEKEGRWWRIKKYAEIVYDVPRSLKVQEMYRFKSLCNSDEIPWKRVTLNVKNSTELNLSHRKG